MREQENLSAMVADAWKGASVQGSNIAEGGVGPQREFFSLASSTWFLVAQGQPAPSPHPVSRSKTVQALALRRCSRPMRLLWCSEFEPEEDS